MESPSHPAGQWARPALLLLTLLGVATCDGPTGPEILGLSIEPEAGLVVGLGRDETFSAFTFDAAGERTHSTSAEWRSGNEQVATITSAGRATAVSAGLTTIYATVDGVTDSATLEVHVPPVVANYLPGTSYFGRKDYVEYIPGELPIVLSAPHGGHLAPREIPTRSYGSTVTDRNTRELTLAVRDALIDLTGEAPHVIISHLDRAKLDPNREIVEAAQGSAFAENAWEEFQGFIETARVTVRSEYGGGMYFDMHGHGHAKERLELGYLLDRETLNRPDASLNSLGVVTESSIRELGRTRPDTFAELLRGATSLGGYLQGEGLQSVPSPGDPTPGSDPYFTGGYNTRRHGSNADSETVSGIQIEHQFPGIRDTDENRRTYAARLAAAMEAFMLAHFGFFDATP